MNEPVYINELAMVVIFALSIILIICIDLMWSMISTWFARHKSYMNWKREKARRAEEARRKVVEKNRAELWLHYPR